MRLSLITAAALIALPPTASAQNFFGRDNSAASGALNNGASAYVSPGARVNSTAAYNMFTALLSPVVGPITFEGIALGTGTPSVTTFSGTGPWAKFSNNGVVTNRNGNYGDGGEALQGRYSTTQASLTSTGRYFRNDGDFDIRLYNSAVTTNANKTYAAAFGFWGVDIGDVGQNLTIQFKKDGVLVHSYTIASSGANDGNVLFYGFVSNSITFDKVIFKSTNGGDVFAFDDFIVGTPGDVIDPPTTATPEPATMGPLATGLVGLALASRRRRKS